ncbi:MAG: MscS family membrane protein [Halioglobus sp.]
MKILEMLNNLVGDYIQVDAPLFMLSLLLLLGICAHYTLAFVVARMTRLADESAQRWDDVVVQAIERPVRVLLWIVIIYFALGVSTGLQYIQDKIHPAYGTMLVLMLAWFLQRLIRGTENELLTEDRGATSSLDKASIHATAKLLRITLYVVTALMVLQALGVSISGLLAFGGIGGIAVGFAAKDLLANFFGGLSIYLDKPFTIGDWIRSPDQEIEGTVEDIGWRLTRIRTFDQRPLYVPNAVFSQVSVENPSRMLNRRIYETIGVRYEDSHSLDTIVAQVRSMLENHEEIDRSRTLIVNFVSFGPSSLDFFIYTFTKTTNWVKFHHVKQDVLIKILAIVHDNGADVAFPTTTLHISKPMAEPEPQS